MPTPQEERERLAIAIADGVSVDWGRIEAEGVLSPQEIRTLRALEALRLRAPGFPSESLAPGKVVGDFRLLALIGQGGMGQVWEAEQTSLGNRHVAVKFVRPERVTERQLELFAREARAGGRLHHPGIVTVHGYGQSEGLAWIAMEFVSGARTLRSFLDEVTRANEVPEGYDRRVARIVAEIAEAMQTAHEAGVIHRDLKPQNVLMTPEDRPKVTDFGLARIIDESALSQTGDIAGTYLYMSPEQVTARRMGIDHRTDIFSLGIVLYECLALRRPFEGDTSHQVAAQIVTKDPPDPRTIRSRIPRDLAVIAGKALEKDRDKRFQTMKELAADLRRFLANEPIHARPPMWLDRTVKWVKRNPGKSSAAAILAVTFTVIALLLFANIRTNRALSRERTNLASANKALQGKTTESEQRRITAEQEKDRADREAETATKGRDDVLRLSALQKLDDLVAEADRLWPAVPENVPKYGKWLRKAGELIAELPDHEQKLAELRSRSVPWTEEEQARHRAEHPKFAELERAKRHVEHLHDLRAALEASEPSRDPTPEEVGVNPAALPASANDVKGLAWDLIDPDRKEWGGEAKGLVLARRAVELAAELSPEDRAGIRDSLAWALFANGRFDEAVAEEEQALEESAADKKQEFEGYLERLEKKIGEEIDPEQDADRAKHLAELEQRIAELETEISKRPEWNFVDAQDKWWHNQLEKLVEGVKAFSDSETGLATSGTSAERGWGVAKRAEFARTIVERSTSSSEASRRWAEAIASIANAAECPLYSGLSIAPQLGLLPIGRDPDSGLWEFAHLQTGEPAERGRDGKLVLKKETGIVFVLMRGGPFTMGAQRSDPSGPNYDPQAASDEGPPHAVTLSPFFLSKYEMAQGQWQRFTGVNPSNYRPPVVLAPSFLHPVEQVSWFDCIRELERLGLALPSEAQWEYGARAGTDSVWWTGSERESLLGAANLADQAATRAGAPWEEIKDWPELDDGFAAHAPVDRFAPNAFGLHNVHGNIWEWCLDGYDKHFYKQSSIKDPVSTPEGSSNRVYRGGSFGLAASFARAAIRMALSPSFADNSLGCRPAKRITP